jgi:hypothetical protein
VRKLLPRRLLAVEDKNEAVANSICGPLLPLRDRAKTEHVLVEAANRLILSCTVVQGGLEDAKEAWSASCHAHFYSDRAHATSVSHGRSRPRPAGEVALAAVAVVVCAGVFFRGPLSRVPENSINFAVGLLLTSFGCFWGAEGAGVEWQGDEVALLGVIGFFGALSFALVRLLRRKRIVPLAAEAQTALLEHNGIDAWWLLPVAVALLLAGSLRRASARLR